MGLPRLFNVLLLCISINAHASNPMDQANSILNYFGANCPTRAEWTQAAIAQANNLATVLESIMNDPDCKTVAGSYSVLNLIQTKLDAIRSDTTTTNVASLRRTQQEVLLQMSASTSVSEQERLRSQLMGIQLNTAAAEAAMDEADAVKREKDRAYAMRQIVAGTNLLVSQTIANSRCMDKNGGLLAGVGALVGSVGAVAATGGAALGIAGGTELFSVLVEKARQHRIAKHINKIAGPVVQTAYKCAIESMTHQWCAADDAERVIQLKAESLTNTNKETPIQLGARILEKDLPTFMNWMERVRSGVDPTNSAMADRQARVLTREKQVREAKVLALGVIAETRILFNSTKADTELETDRLRWTIERQLLSDITNMSSQLSPLAETIESGYVPYYLMGLERSEAPKNFGFYKGLDAFDPFSPTDEKNDNWPAGRTPFKPDLEIIKTRVESWIKMAQAKIAQELSIILQPDPLQLVNDAGTRNQFGRSTYESLQEIIRFLKQQSPSSIAIGSHIRLYEDTVERLETIEKHIKKVMESKHKLASSPTAISEDLAEIYTAANLNSGTVLLQVRLERAIRTAMSEILNATSSQADFETTSKLLAADDILAELRRYSSRSDLNLMSRDLLNSKTIVRNTLKNLGDFFHKGIAKSLKDAAAGAVGKSEKQSFAEYCLKLAILPEWPKKADLNLCLGTQVSSVYTKGPTARPITLEFLGLPFEERVCEYRNYLRSNFLFEEYYLNRRP